ncbi:hypothetical protein E0Z10_g5173 [Xylaria hypoxylon]|uniref:Uncharacterized protein n=1 Tax=Xylaria hypoxylon TaxID=37992 RepID=A0A4Z0YWM3_9PEZI|nr:hypothetical protein E0Z10_g5173 [Xylaria hypoxylon]
MDDPIRDHRGDPPARSERKRPNEHHDADGRRVRRRSDEHANGTHTHKRRSRSPRRSEHPDHRDNERAGGVNQARHRHGDTRDDRYETGHRSSARNHTDSRSRSPTRHRHSHRRRDDMHRHRSNHASTASHQDRAPELPCDARPLSRSADLNTFRPLFAQYLDIQKQIDISTLNEREVRGRWKSFVSKWNNRELAEGWYRPEMFEDVMLDSREVGDKPEGERRHAPPRDFSTRQSEVLGGKAGADLRPQDSEEREDDGDDDDDYGPTLPTQDNLGHVTSIAESLSQTKHGPSIPSLSDLTLRRELEVSDRDDARALLRQERRADRTIQKEKLDELVPRADAGTQARKLEKKREVRNSNTSFANAKSSNEMPDLPDAELMGGDGGGIEEYKKLKREGERKKTEREVRREEIWRAKQEEREERAREYREREAHTVDMLREIAKSRFG